MEDIEMTQVLVTGATGFLGSHCIAALLAAGYRVRGTVRSPAKEAAARALVAAAGVDAGDRLRIVTADLTADAGWADAVAGCEHVLHTASPFPARQPEDAQELIRPAREGTLRVLRAARDAGVRRTVVTSSFAAVGYGRGAQDRPFDERDWTDVDGADTQPYMQSKTLAERAAWDFAAQEGTAMELAVINPVGIFGPALGPELSTSIGFIQAMLLGRMEAVPRMHFGVVDVRDVADLHMRAMIAPQAAGERFIATAGPALSLLDVATILRRDLGAQGARAPQVELADEAVRRIAAETGAMADLVPQLGIVREATSAKARDLLDWQPRPAAEAVLASARSLIALGLVPDEAAAG